MTRVFVLLGEASTVRQWALAALLIAIGVLFLATIACSAYVVVLRLRHRLKEDRREQLARRWRDRVLQAVGDPALVPTVHQLVDPSVRLPFVGFVLEFARRVRGQERETLETLVQPFLPAIVARVDSHSVEVRARAIQTLGSLGLPEYATTVVAALDDPSPLVAMVAARALARADRPQYAGEVLERLGRFEGWNRRFLASMLASIGPSVSETLRRGLADRGRQPRVRAVLAEALTLQRDFLAGDVAAEALAGAESRELVVSLLRLLSVVGRPDHVGVVRSLGSSPDVVIKAQALRALGALGGEREIPMLVEAMSDPFPWAALYAARGIREAGGREVLAALAASDRPVAALAGQVLTEGGEVGSSP